MLGKPSNHGYHIPADQCLSTCMAPSPKVARKRRSPDRQTEIYHLLAVFVVELVVFTSPHGGVETVVETGVVAMVPTPPPLARASCMQDTCCRCAPDTACHRNTGGTRPQHEAPQRAWERRPCDHQAVWKFTGEFFGSEHLLKSVQRLQPCAHDAILTFSTRGLHAADHVPGRHHPRL